MVKKVECLECEEVYELSKNYPISMIRGIYCSKCNADYCSLVALNDDVIIKLGWDYYYCFHEDKVLIQHKIHANRHLHQAYTK